MLREEARARVAAVDEEHMMVGPYAIEKYAISDLEQAAVRKSLQITLDIFWLVYDGMVRAVVDEDPLYASWRDPVVATA